MFSSSGQHQRFLQPVGTPAGADLERAHRQHVDRLVRLGSATAAASGSPQRRLAVAAEGRHHATWPSCTM